MSPSDQVPVNIQLRVHSRHSQLMSPSDQVLFGYIQLRVHSRHSQLLRAVTRGQGFPVFFWGLLLRVLSFEASALLASNAACFGQESASTFF